MRKLSAPAAFCIILLIVTVALAIALMNILAAPDWSFQLEKDASYFGLTFGFSLIFVGVGAVIFGLPIIKALRTHNRDGSFVWLVGSGLVAGCLYSFLVTLLFTGGVPSTRNDMQFFFGLGGGGGAFAGALWWLLARPKVQELG